MAEDDYGFDYDPLNKAHRAKRVADRELVVHHLRRIARELAELEAAWTRKDMHHDTLGENEWPFDKSLEDMVAEVSHCASKIEEINDLLRLEPVTITVDAATYNELVAAINRPPKVNEKLRAALERAKELK